MKDTSYIQTRLARARVEEERKEEIAAKAREERELRESRKKEKEKKRKEIMEKKKAKKSTDSEGESDSLEAEEGGFSIPRSRASSPSDWSQEPGAFKRPSGSPASAAPGSKNVKMSHNDSDSRRGPGHH